MREASIKENVLSRPSAPENKFVVILLATIAIVTQTQLNISPNILY